MTKNNLKPKEQGRSMIEMIGVLAIIGVLSVGALSGYRMAMTRYRANEVIDYAMRVAEAAAHHGTTQKTGNAPYTGDDACKSYVNEEEAPLDMNCYIYNTTLGGVVPAVSFAFAEGSYSDKVGEVIEKQVGVCDGVTRIPCVIRQTICANWLGNLAGQPCVRFMFKK